MHRRQLGTESKYVGANTRAKVNKTRATASDSPAMKIKKKYESTQELITKKTNLKDVTGSAKENKKSNPPVLTSKAKVETTGINNYIAKARRSPQEQI